MPIKVLANDTAILANNVINAQQPLTIEVETYEDPQSGVILIPEENRPNTISQKHWDEWTKESGISAEITEKCLQSLDNRQEIAQKLGWKGYPNHNSLGWFAS